jgi:RNA polymerase sigma-70 factor (ECF subfamily)
MPLLDDALNLACWLSGNRADAEDIVQEAMLRAYKYLDRYTGGSFRPWLLAIVRNTALTLLGQNRSTRALFLAGDSAEQQAESTASDQPSPEEALTQRRLSDQVNQAVANLPPEFREVIILREMHDLSYKEISAVLEIPIGTVMSRLSRARKLLMDALPDYAT